MDLWHIELTPEAHSMMDLLAPEADVDCLGDAK
jgi:hypothetical protein